VNSFFRFTTNSLWGVGGIFDVATDLNIPKSPQNFGRTLGRWGVGSGPYLVLPLFGPSSVRDTVGTLVDMQGNLVSHSSNVPTRNSAMALRAVDVRANLLTAGDFLEAVSLDKYSFARDIYLQRHRANKSEPAPEPAAEERYDLPEPAVGAGEAAAPVPVAAPASAPVSAPVSAAAAQ
jgi:phospholipid-binding lipoprotein MlaA